MLSHATSLHILKAVRLLRSAYWRSKLSIHSLTQKDNSFGVEKKPIIGFSLGPGIVLSADEDVLSVSLTISEVPHPVRKCQCQFVEGLLLNLRWSPIRSARPNVDSILLPLTIRPDRASGNDVGLS